MQTNKRLLTLALIILATLACVVLERTALAIGLLYPQGGYVPPDFVRAMTVALMASTAIAAATLSGRTLGWLGGAILCHSVAHWSRMPVEHVETLLWMGAFLSLVATLFTLDACLGNAYAPQPKGKRRARRSPSRRWLFA